MKMYYRAGTMVHPNLDSKSHWIEIRFKTTEDLERGIDLVKMAIAGK